MKSLSNLALIDSICTLLPVDKIGKYNIAVEFISGYRRFFDSLQDLGRRIVMEVIFKLDAEGVLSPPDDFSKQVDAIYNQEHILARGRPVFSDQTCPSRRNIDDRCPQVKGCGLNDGRGIHARPCCSTLFVICHCWLALPKHCDFPD